jgi:hypothetical protein
VRPPAHGPATRCAGPFVSAANTPGKTEGQDRPPGASLEKSLSPRNLPDTFEQWASGQGFPPGTLPDDDADSNGVPDILQFFSGDPSGLIPNQSLAVENDMMVWTFGVPGTVAGITPRSIVLDDLETMASSAGPPPQAVSTTATKAVYRVDADHPTATLPSTGDRVGLTPGWLTAQELLSTAKLVK